MCCWAAALRTRTDLSGSRPHFTVQFPNQLLKTPHACACSNATGVTGPPEDARYITSHTTTWPEAVSTARKDMAVDTATTGSLSNGTTQSELESTDLYQNVYAYVEKYMSRYDASHDFAHIRRVLGLSKYILAEELKANPTKQLRQDAVILGALLHDVGDKKYVQPGENSEQLIADLLTKNGCSPIFVAKIAIIVENVSYSNETKRPQLVKAIIGSHPELAVVQDADRLDAIGAVGIGRVFAFGAARAPDRGLQGCIDHFDEKLVKLESMMKTDTGRRLARERTERLKQFQQWWSDENAMFAA